MTAAVVHFLPLTLIHRERRLPQPGKVVVRSGQKVGASEVIAETTLNPEYQILDIARTLGITSAKVEQYLQCKAGDQLSQGDLIAGPVGLSNRVVRAQRDAKVVSVSEGQVLLESLSKPFQLKAGFSGDVVELILDRGAIIETTGALIQGVWGNGRLDSGILSVVNPNPDHSLSMQDMDVSLRGSVILAGTCQDLETLKMAEELVLRGVILGSLAPALIPFAKKMRVPVILIEGIGQFPMNPVAHKLLATNERREVAVMADSWNPYKGIRPEIIIPLPAPENVTTPVETGSFGAEKRVRIVEYPYLGNVGIILKIVHQASFSGGLKAPAAEIRMMDGKSITIPLANLELIQ